MQKGRQHAAPDWRIMADTPPEIVVIGGVNMDLAGTPVEELRGGDSNPGRVMMTPGGVGRNIAENLRRLGRRVSLITMLGEDPFGEAIQRHCGELGIDLRMSAVVPGAHTSTYLCVNEQNGDLHTAIADMAIMDQLTPERLEGHLGTIQRAEMVIVDANVPEKTLAWLGEMITAPLAADPVSVAKVERLKPILSRLRMLKPNVPEAERLTGMTIRGDADIMRAAECLRAMGLERVFLSLGARGVYAAGPGEQGFLPCYPGIVRNTTGCGDAFLAAAAEAWLEGKGTLASARWGLAAAAHCAAEPRSVSPTLTKAIIQQQLTIQ